MSLVKENKVNPDLAKERMKCSFKTAEFTNWWYGGQELVKRRRKIEKYFLEDPNLKSPVPLSYLSDKEKYEETIRRISVTAKRMQQWRAEGNGPLEFEDGSLLGGMRSGITPSGNPLGLHFGMFANTIIGQGTVEQQAQWVDKARNLEIIGTYAQTELGHGTFVRGLETTATYDVKTEEFVLNSPTLSSYKWWPGGMGHTTSHCILVAQLYTQGKHCGVFPFVVQLRDSETHVPLKGITIGEIGTKMGLTTVNQGFLGFDKVRIPRNHMLMKNAQVLKDGTFVKGAPDVLTYGTMTFIRVGLVRGSADFLATGATIAVRYSAVRKQSQINPTEPEVQIMDHLTQQYKLFPQLAKCIVFKLAADYIWDMYTEVTAELENGQLGRLPEMHALSCCLKSVTTTDATLGIETLRLACGGHGYMASSNMTTLYGFTTAARTYEGENTVLLLQTSRYLMKAWKSAFDGKTLKGTVAYLNKVVSTTAPPQFQRTVQGIVEAFQFSTGKQIQKAFDNIESRKRTGMSNEAATNATSIALARAAELHCRSFLIASGYLYSQKLMKSISPEMGKILQDLMELYAIDTALSNLDVLMASVAINQEDVADLQSRLEGILGRIRPNAVGIVDSFDFHDEVLNSTLGAYDGNAYERLFADALKSPLNQEPVNKSFDLYLKPLMAKSKM